MSHKGDTACLFCNIANHILASKVVFENNFCIAFHDIHPRAKTHVLVIPKKHIISLSDAKKYPKEYSALWDATLETSTLLGVLDNAKLELHSGEMAGQEIPHLHVHILSSKELKS